MENDKVYSDIPFTDLLPQQTLWHIQDDAYFKALANFKKIDPNFKENLHTFEYEFICRVKIKRIDDTPTTRTTDAS